MQHLWHVLLVLPMWHNMHATNMRPVTWQHTLPTIPGVLKSHSPTHVVTSDQLISYCVHEVTDHVLFGVHCCHVAHVARSLAYELVNGCG